MGKSENSTDDMCDKLLDLKILSEYGFIIKTIKHKDGT